MVFAHNLSECEDARGPVGLARLFVPSGTPENSPPLQRWEMRSPTIRSPGRDERSFEHQGAIESQAPFAEPRPNGLSSLTGLQWRGGPDVAFNASVIQPHEVREWHVRPSRTSSGCAAPVESKATQPGLPRYQSGDMYIRVRAGAEDRDGQVIWHELLRQNPSLGRCIFDQRTLNDLDSIVLALSFQ